jgi:hypothetical protein
MRTAYHFLREDMTAGFGAEPPWTVGGRREMPKAERVALCLKGYHSSPSWLDALQYAPGPMACIVEIPSRVSKDTTKQVGRWRRLIAVADASRELRLFACDCAERALLARREAGREPAPASWEAVAVARRFAVGEAAEGELRAAAASDAVTYSAFAAAACCSASAYAAFAAFVASDAADGEREWQRQHLAEMLEPLFKDHVE